MRLQEGNLEKLLAAREKALAERESEIQSLRSENFRAAIHGELSREATALEAVSASQVLRMFGDPADWVRIDKGEIVHKTIIDNAGVPVTPRSLLEREKSGQNANLFRSALRSGSGAAAGSSGGNGAAGVLSIKKVGGAITAADQPRYEAHVKAAREAGVEPRAEFIE